MLSLVLSAAALFAVPSAAWSDGGNASDVEKDRDGCDRASDSFAKLKVSMADGNDSRLQVTGTVFSDDNDVWTWKLKHNGGVSDEGRARGREDVDLSFRISRTMINFLGTDTVVFRAENQQTGEVCRTSVDY
ncbi:uncharacterized protein (Precursor) [Nocardioides sp. PD653]|nr:uncharacterized protein (Precursor) [Nocardioides sp. PD653-B2]GAW53290.1 uncharacterized protein (Precursor) [Nocardioides sp. PD653]